MVYWVGGKIQIQTTYFKPSLKRYMTRYNIEAIQGDYFKCATIGNLTTINFKTKF